jgi:hypothetical protein
MKETRSEPSLDPLLEMDHPDVQDPRLCQSMPKASTDLIGSRALSAWTPACSQKVLAQQYNMNGQQANRGSGRFWSLTRSLVTGTAACASIMGTSKEAERAVIVLPFGAIHYWS